MGRSPGFQFWQKRGKHEEGGAWRDTRPPSRVLQNRPRLVHLAPRAGSSYLRCRGSPGPGPPRGREALGAALAKAPASPPLPGRGERRRQGESE